MGKLVSQQLKTLFGGVSRQPQPVRRENQVQEATNALLSVVSGGFEKRPASQHLNKLTGVSLGVDYAVHAIDRDPTEQYIVLLGNNQILVYDAITGTQKTVNIADSARYLTINSDLASVGVTGFGVSSLLYPSGETQIDLTPTGIASGTVVVEGSADGLTGWTTVATFTSNTPQTVTIYPFMRVRVSSGGTGNFSIRGTFKDMSYLKGVLPEEFAFVTVADFTFIVSRAEIVEMGPPDGGSVQGTVQTFDALPGSPTLNDIYKIQGDNVDGFDSYFVKWDGSVWSETVAPNGINTFAAQSMPHQLVREADGTFTYKQATWASRAVGDVNTVPVPSFVGRSINDIFFHRSRMGVVADENVYFSRTGEPLNMWPEKAVDTLDTDPIDRAASNTQVTILKWATPFRKLLFLTSDNAQFEVSADTNLTGETAVIDLTTTYSASSVAKPTVMGDTLYFASHSPDAAVLYEYFFDEASLSNTASDVTKHVVDYVPREIIRIATEPVSGTVFSLSSGESNAIFVYKTFWDGSDKVMSSWSKWTLGATEAEAFIHGFAVLSGYLVVVVERTDGIYLEQIQIEREAVDENLGFLPLIDQRTILTGVYDSGDNLTTWTLPYAHDDDAIIILGGDFDEPGRQLTVEYPTATTVTAIGDFTGGEVYVGRPYTHLVELSKIYYREAATSAPVVDARIQLKQLILTFEKSGYFRVRVTPAQRDPFEFEFTGRVIGDGSNQIGLPAIVDNGTFKVPIFTRADTAKIEIINDSPFPNVITSLTWRGFFTELTRQEP